MPKPMIDIPLASLRCPPETLPGRPCAACGSKEDLQHHRLFTRRGRGKFADKWITLCYSCHAKLHERQSLLPKMTPAPIRQREGI